MLISKIVAAVNEQLAGERLTVAKMLTHLDYALHDINETINADFPTLTEYAAEVMAEDQQLTIDNVDYNLFPPRYISTVLVLGAARHFYRVDEEGAVNVPVLDAEYGKHLFFMQRDYIHAVPEKYRDCEYNGSIEHVERKTTGSQVLELPSAFGNIWG